jgi:hypothetical protein
VVAKAADWSRPRNRVNQAPRPAATRTPNSQKIFWFFFSKKNKENKRFFLKKVAKTFANCGGLGTT